MNNKMGIKVFVPEDAYEFSDCTGCCRSCCKRGKGSAWGRCLGYDIERCAHSENARFSYLFHRSCSEGEKDQAGHSPTATLLQQQSQ